MKRKYVSGKMKNVCDSGNNGKIVFTGSVLLAKEYYNKDGSPSIDPTGWWASEKFDGFRSLWNGKSFLSRNGIPFTVPDWFSALMPPGVALDGEFWLARGKFEEGAGVFKKKVPDEAEWIELDVKYKVFDVPSLTNEPFEERMKYLKNLIEERCNCMIRVNVSGETVDFKCPLQLTEQTKVLSETHLQELFVNVTKNQGEGIMLREAGSLYEQKRSKTLLKMKVAFDTECEIIGYKPGTGRNSETLGSFHCALKTGEKFYVGSGVSDEIRANYEATHPIGTIITIMFNDYTTYGKPRFPRYWRKRSD